MTATFLMQYFRTWVLVSGYHSLKGMVLKCKLSINHQENEINVTNFLELQS